MLVVGKEKTDLFLQSYFSILEYQSAFQVRENVALLKDGPFRKEVFHVGSEMRLSRELSDEAEIYEAIVTADDDDLDIQRQLKGISLLGANALLPATLSAFVVDFHASSFAKQKWTHFGVPVNQHKKINKILLCALNRFSLP